MRFHKLDINLLVVLDHLLQGKGVAETARLLHITQPAISNALARLREHFQDPLFVAIGRKLEPTPFASSLATAVHHALKDLERIVCARADFTPATQQRTFTIVCSDYSYAVLVQKLVQRVALIAPKMTLQVLLLSEAVVSLLDAGTIDFLLAPSPLVSPQHPKLDLFSESYSCIAWSGNQAIGERLSREQYLQAAHVDTILGLCPPKQFEVVPPYGGPGMPHTAIRAPTFSAMAETVVGTPYLATIHTRLAELMAQRLPLRVLKLPVPQAGFIECLQWHRSKDQDAGTVWLRDIMVALAKEM